MYESTNTTEDSPSEACVQSSVELKQHVTFPNHFQVPKALKSSLTFKNFDTFPALELSDKSTTSRLIIHILLMCFCLSYQLTDHSLFTSFLVCVCERVFLRALFNCVKIMYGCIILVLFSYIKLLNKTSIIFWKDSNRKVGRFSLEIIPYLFLVLFVNHKAKLLFLL